MTFASSSPLNPTELPSESAADPTVDTADHVRVVLNTKTVRLAEQIKTTGFKWNSVWSAAKGPVQYNR
jgi:hypothetical protein